MHICCEFCNFCQEFAQRLSTLLSLQNPLYVKELHAVSSLLFSLLPTFNFKLSATTFDFYFDIRNVCLMPMP